MKIQEHIDLSAEAYFLSVFPARARTLKYFFLDCKGTHARGREREVLQHQFRTSVVDDQFLELEGIEVSRNGIYHLLPESLFHPLTLGRYASNTYEIVQEIRDNRDREQENKLFFTPLDTEIFLFKARMISDQIDAVGFSKRISREILRNFTGGENAFFEGESHILMACLAKSQELKENPKALSLLLSKLLACEVKILEEWGESYEPPYLPLGMGKLGVDTICAGPSALEGYDWKVEVITQDIGLIDLAITDDRLEKDLVELLEYFSAAPREIEVKWIASGEFTQPELGQGLLGINTFTQTLN